MNASPFCAFALTESFAILGQLKLVLKPQGHIGGVPLAIDLALRAASGSLLCALVFNHSGEFVCVNLVTFC